MKATKVALPLPAAWCKNKNGRNGKERVGFKESDFLSEGGVLGWREILSKGVGPYALTRCQFLFFIITGIKVELR